MLTSKKTPSEGPKTPKAPAKTPPIQSDWTLTNAMPQKTNAAQAVETKKAQKTRILIKYDVGFHNSLYIRGHGANLNWEKGILLKNVKNDEWIWETETPFTTCEFKVLINDKQYESGDNHHLTYGVSIQYTPKF